MRAPGAQTRRRGAGLLPASGSRRGREPHSCVAHGRPGSHLTDLSDHRRRRQHHSSATLQPLSGPPIESGAAWSRVEADSEGSGGEGTKADASPLVAAARHDTADHNPIRAPGAAGPWRERFERVGRPSGMSAFRVFLFCLGIVLLIGAALVALVRVAEPVPGMHCLVMRQTGVGRFVRSCPDVRYVRHTGIAIGMTVASVVLIVGSRPRLRRS